jgi:hypothetical protein
MSAWRGACGSRTRPARASTRQSGSFGGGCLAPGGAGFHEPVDKSGRCGLLDGDEAPVRTDWRLGRRAAFWVADADTGSGWPAWRWVRVVRGVGWETRGMAEAGSGRLIAAGRSADVYEVGDGRVLRR